MTYDIAVLILDLHTEIIAGILLSIAPRRSSTQRNACGIVKFESRVGIGLGRDQGGRSQRRQGDGSVEHGYWRS